MKDSTNNRQDKRARFAVQDARPPRRASRLSGVIALSLVAVAIGILGFLGARRVASASVAASPAVAPMAATIDHEPYPALEANKGAVRLPLSSFTDGATHFYTYMHGSRPIEVFVVLGSDWQPRAAFNACDVCYRAKKGYYQDGDDMVCGNCGNRFPIDQIGSVQGGCNPAPLKNTVDKADLVVRVEDIIAGARLF